MSDRAGPDPVLASTVVALEAACDRFEAAWRSGDRPRLGDFLQGSEELRADLLRELLTIDIAYRRAAGEQPEPGDYAGLAPGRDAEIAEALEGGATSGPPESSRPDPPVAPIIEGLEVLEEIGRGGMGVVYRARQERLRRFVALKMILAGEHSGPEAVARLQREAEAAARLVHPGIVRVYGIGDYRGRPYIVMEHVEGGNLAQSLGEAPWPAREAARLVGALAEAVAHAHQRGVVHRDLKPANVLIAADGSPKVTDFGLAKCLDDEPDLTRSRVIVGSPAYMAPEQADGRNREIGPTADVHALGVILYELLTGSRPFHGGSALETLELVRSTEPTPPSRLVPGLPRDLVTICLACLRKDPRHRYDDARALAEDLRRFVASEPIAARRVGPVERATLWARRQPATAGLGLLASLSSLLLVVVLATRPGRPASMRGSTPTETLTSQPTPPRPTARGYRDVPPVAAPMGHFSRPESASDGWLKMAKDGGRSVRRSVLRGHTADVWDAALSPDGQTVASAGFDATVRLWDVNTETEQAVLQGHSDRVYTVAFDPTGGRVVSASADRTAMVWKLGRLMPLHVLIGHTDNARCAVFSPDGGEIVTGSWDGALRTWDAATGRPVRTIPTGAGRITRVAYAPDGDSIAVAGTANVVEQWDHLRARRLSRFRGHDQDVLGVAYGPLHSQGLLASTAGDPDGRTGGVLVWDSATGAVQYRLAAQGVAERVVFCPDGRLLATAGWDGLVTLWDARDGQAVLALRGHEGRVWGVAFGPDGRSIVSAGSDRTVRLWSLPMPN